jgi:hypothetical protein
MNLTRAPNAKVMWNADRGFLQASFGPTCDGGAEQVPPDEQRHGRSGNHCR